VELQADTILHTTLLRVLTPEQLTLPQLEHIQELCEKHTRALAGIEVRPQQTWMVMEKEFGTLEGEKITMPFAH